MTSVLCILVNYKNAKSTISAINSIRAMSSFEQSQIIVVDNECSKLEETEQLRRSSADLVVPSTVNLGFAGAVNLAVNSSLKSNFDFIWLLNNDAVADAVALSTLVAAADAHNAAIVGGTIYYLERPQVIWTEKSVLHTPWFLVRNVGKNKHKPPQDLPRKCFEVEFVNGCSMLIRRTDFERLGGFDDRLFLYCEDVDFCMRCRKIGGRIIMAPASIVYHAVSLSTGGEFNATREYYITRNSLEMINRYVNSRFVRVIAILSRFPWDAYRFLRTGVRNGKILETLRLGKLALKDGISSRLGRMPYKL